MELFDNFEKNKLSSAPLADRIRPEKLEDFLGQERLLARGNLYARPLKKMNCNRLSSGVHPVPEKQP